MDLTRKKVFGTDSHGCCLQSSLFFCVDPHFHLYNFPFSMQVSLNISCAVGLLETSSFGSCIAESIFLSSSFRSDVSAGLRSSRLRVCLWGLERCGSVVFSCFAAYVNSALYLKHRFLWLLWRYVSLLLVSNRFFFFFFMMGLGVVFFLFLVLGHPWASWNCGFIVPSKSEKSPDIIFCKYFLYPPAPLGTSVTDTLGCLKLSHSSRLFFPF